MGKKEFENKNELRYILGHRDRSRRGDDWPSQALRLAVMNQLLMDSLYITLLRLRVYLLRLNFESFRAGILNLEIELDVSFESYLNISKAWNVC